MNKLTLAAALSSLALPALAGGTRTVCSSADGIVRYEQTFFIPGGIPRDPRFGGPGLEASVKTAWIIDGAVVADAELAVDTVEAELPGPQKSLSQVDHAWVRRVIVKRQGNLSFSSGVNDYAAYLLCHETGNLPQ